MTIRNITEENVLDYAEIIPPECVYDIGREYTGGFAGEDDETKETVAIILWELKNVEDEDVPTEAELQWFYASSVDTGKEILSVFDQSIKKNGVKRTFFEMPELSDDEKEALTDAGFSIIRAESMSIFVTVEDMVKLKLPMINLLNNVKSLSEITARQFKSGIMNCIYHKRYGLLDDLPFLPMSRYDPDISSCVIMDGRVAGFLLVHETQSGAFRPELLFAVEPDSRIHMLNMMSFSINMAAQTISESGIVQIKRYNMSALKLATKLFPGKKGDMVMRGERKRA